MKKTIKKSSVKRKKNPLKAKIDKQVKHEKCVGKVTRLNTDVKDFSKMNSEEQRKILFNQFPGDAMGVVVGKPDKNDPYNALLPVEDNT